jgi:hypothetical protein
MQDQPAEYCLDMPAMECDACLMLCLLQSSTGRVRKVFSGTLMERMRNGEHVMRQLPYKRKDRKVKKFRKTASVLEGKKI